MKVQKYAKPPTTHPKKGRTPQRVDVTLKDLLKAKRTLKSEVLTKPSRSWGKLQIIMTLYPKGKLRFFRALLPEKGNRITSIHTLDWFDVDTRLHRRRDEAESIYKEYLAFVRSEIADGSWPEQRDYTDRCNVTGRTPEEFQAKVCSTCTASCCTVPRATTG